MNIPKNHQTVMPYLILKGALNFIEFTKTVLNATVLHAPHLRDDGTAQHAEINIHGCTIMVADASEDWLPQTANLFVYVPNADESFKKALEEGATELMGLSDQEYGRTCGVTDPFGNVWWITSVNEFTI
jgi:PhnB protein